VNIQYLAFAPTKNINRFSAQLFDIDKKTPRPTPYQSDHRHININRKKRHRITPNALTKHPNLKQLKQTDFFHFP